MPNIDRILDGLDDSLEPISDKVVATEDNNKPGDDTTAKDDTSSTDADDNKRTDDEDDEGYTIDQVDGEPDEEVKVADPVKSGQLSPELQYISDNIQPITVRGVVGDSEEVKEYKVLDPSHLPRGFKYLDDRDRDIAGKSFVMLENRALQLQSDFRTQENTKSQKAFKEAEEKADWEDIAALQKAGDLAKFRIKPDDPKFNEDPTAELIDKVLEFKDSENVKYLEAYNKGRPYRHIGFEEAYSKYLKVNPQEKTSPEQKKEDIDRKKVADRTRATNGDTAPKNQKPFIAHSKRDMDNFIDALDW